MAVLLPTMTHASIRERLPRRCRVCRVTSDSGRVRRPARCRRRARAASRRTGVAAVDVLGLGHRRSCPGPPARPAPAPHRPGCRGATTGAPESIGTPRTTAWCPSVRRSAPRRASSWANMNRASKTFSVIIAVPSRPRPAPSRTAAGRSGTPGRAASRRRRTRAGRRIAHAEAVARRSITVAPADDQLVEHDVEVPRRAPPRTREVTPGDGRGEGPGAGDDPVGDGGVLDRVEPVDALHASASRWRRRRSWRPSRRASGTGR